MAREKAVKAPKEVRRNDPKIDLILNITRISVTTVVCLVVTYLCTWFNYVVQTPDAEFYNFAGMMEYVDKNINFMSSYIVCAFILWAAIGFVLATLLVKFIKYCLNYK